MLRYYGFDVLNINETLLGFCIFYIDGDYGSGCFLVVNLLLRIVWYSLFYHVGAAMNVG